MNLLLYLQMFREANKHLRQRTESTYGLKKILSSKSQNMPEVISIILVFKIGWVYYESIFMDSKY